MSAWVEGESAVRLLLEAKKIGQPVQGLKAKNASLSGVDLSGMVLVESEFDTVDFSNCNLERIVLSDCEMKAVRLDGARLNSATFFKTPISGSSALGVYGYRWTVANSNVNGLDFTGSDLPEAKFAMCEFQDCALSGSNLNHAAFVQVVHKKTNFSNCFLKQCVLHDLDLRTCVFKNVDAPMVVISSSILDGLDLSSCDLNRIQGHKASLRGTTMRHANLVGACFVDADVSQAIFSDALLSQASFLRVRGMGANFSAAEMTQVKVIDCDFSKSTFEQIQAEQSIWHRSMLSESNFVGAKLFQADLIGAILRNSDLRKADFRRARLDRIDFEDALYDSDAMAVSRPKDDAYAEFILASA